MPRVLSNVLPILVQAHPDGEQRKSAQGLTARQLGALERVPARIEDALEHMDAIIEMLAAEGGEAGARRKRASSILRCLDDAIARLPRAAELDRTRLIVERNHDFIFHGSPVLMAHVLARVIEAALNEVHRETGAQLTVTSGPSRPLELCSPHRLLGRAPRRRGAAALSPRTERSGVLQPAGSGARQSGVGTHGRLGNADPRVWTQRGDGTVACPARRLKMPDDPGDPGLAWARFLPRCCAGSDDPIEVAFRYGCIHRQSEKRSVPRG